MAPMATIQHQLQHSKTMIAIDYTTTPITAVKTLPGVPEERKELIEGVDGNTLSGCTWSNGEYWKSHVPNLVLVSRANMYEIAAAVEKKKKKDAQAKNKAAKADAKAKAKGSDKSKGNAKAKSAAKAKAKGAAKKRKALGTGDTSSSGTDDDDEQEDPGAPGCGWSVWDDGKVVEGDDDSVEDDDRVVKDDDHEDDEQEDLEVNLNHLGVKPKQDTIYIYIYIYKSL